MRRTASEIIKNLERRTARLEKYAYSWEEKAVKDLADILMVDLDDIVSSEIYYLKGIYGVEVKTKYDSYIVFHTKEDYQSFLDLRLLELAQNKLSDRDIVDLLGSWDDFSDYSDSYGELEPKHFDENRNLGKISDYKHLLRLESEGVLDEDEFKEAVEDLCEIINKNPLDLDTKDLRILFKEMKIDTLAILKNAEYEVEDRRYEKVLSDSASKYKDFYALEVR